MTIVTSAILVTLGIIVVVTGIIGLTIFFCSVNTRTDFMNNIIKYDEEDPIDGYVDYYYFEEDNDIHDNDDDNFNTD